MIKNIFIIGLVLLSVATRMWPDWDGLMGWATLTPGEAKVLAGVYVTGALVLLGTKGDV